MITAIIRNKENTLVLELPHSIYDIYEKLQSIGIMQPPKQIPLTDNEDEDIGVKLFSESDFGRHLLLTLQEKNTIADANIADNKCMLGVGFIGYIDSESDEKAVQELVNDSALASAYPFLKGLDEVVIEGSELYAFVPADKAAVITVYYAEISENGSYIDHKDTPLYIGNAGEAVVVRCNLSEIYSNVLISVKDGANTLEYHPMLSMKDGHVATEFGCYDFTDYEMTEEELAQNASDLLTATDEVRDALGRGMKLLYTGDIQVIGGRQCLLFALGTEHEEQFVREQLYAVSDDQIYAYSAVTDSWEPLGAG